MFAQFKVQGAYARYSTVATERRQTGAEVARSILDANGLSNVPVQMSKNGVLSDHFDPKNNTVNLSPKVYSENSIASVAVAAHEVGHALQYAQNYAFIGLRNRILPIAVISSSLGWTVIIIGLISGIDFLFTLGLFMLLAIAGFQLITLPIEFDASKRALNILQSSYLVEDEVSDAKSMLDAAALTYVAAFASTLLNIVRLVSMRNRNRR